MKKILLFILISCFVISCDDAGVIEEEKIVDSFVGTIWEARDDIAEVIYGNGCTTSIEFLGSGACQTIDIHPSFFGGISTKVIPGTYTFKGDSVAWTEGETKISALRTGSVLNSSMGTIAGGKRIYIKK